MPYFIAKSERLNCVLNERVQNSADWIQWLWGLLHEKRQRCCRPNEGSLRAPQRNQEEFVVIERRKQDLQTASMQAYQVFEAQNIRLVSEPWTVRGRGDESELWSRVETGDLGSQLMCVQHIPFDVHATSQAVWAALMCSGSSDACENMDDADNLMSKVRVVKRTHKICSMKYQMGIQLGHSSEPTPASCYAVTQQFGVGDADGVTLFVWRSFSSFDTDDAESNGIMWIAVSGSPISRLASRVAIVARSHVRVSLQPDGAVVRASIMAAREACVSNILSSVENLLLDEASTQLTNVNGGNEGAAYGIVV